MSDQPSATGWIVASVLVGLVGAVWFGQGIGVIPGSFMSGDLTWAWIGGTLVLSSVGVAAWARRR